MSQSSLRIERRSVDFNIQENIDIDPTALLMATFDQDTINTLVTDFQQAAAAATPPAKINAAPSPATIAEKFVEDPYKTGINTGTSNGKKLYQDATKEMDSKDLITVNAKNARNFGTQIKKRLNLHHW